MYDDDQRERKQLIPLIIPTLKASHIRLVKGIYVVNPHIAVLCPVLATTGSCKKKEDGRKRSPRARPKLLLKHHSVPGLELWMCLGCQKDFLLRVEL